MKSKFKIDDVVYCIAGQHFGPTKIVQFKITQIKYLADALDKDGNLKIDVSYLYFDQGNIRMEKNDSYWVSERSVYATFEEAAEAFINKEVKQAFLKFANS